MKASAVREFVQERGGAHLACRLTGRARRSARAAKKDRERRARSDAPYQSFSVLGLKALGTGENGSNFNRWCLFLAVALALCLTGCSERSSSEAPAVEVRGQPIASAPSQSAEASAASSNAPAKAVAATNPKSETRNSEPEFALAGFDILSGYEIEISDELLGPVTNDLAAVTAKTEALIPPKVKALDQKRVALKGFMLPLKVEGGLVTEMLVMKDQSMCCYGTVPKIHEWVSIKMVEKGVRPMMDQPVTLFGKLHVGEMRENGYLTGIYRMDGEKMAAEEN